MIETCESADNHSHLGKSRRGPKISKELPCLDKSCIFDGFCGSFLGKSNIFIFVKLPDYNACLSARGSHILEPPL